jgi:hypothetical protein
MAFDKTALKDYVDVAERLRSFYGQYPEARVETSIINLTENRVVVRAEVYRTADETRPAGTGHSAMNIPGSTPYTRGSELENCETSAVGRAIVAAGLPSKRIASEDEVAAKRGGDEVAAEPERQGAERLATEPMKKKFFAIAKEAGLGAEQLKALSALVTGRTSSAEYTFADIDKLIAEVNTKGAAFQQAVDVVKVG